MSRAASSAASGVTHALAKTTRYIVRARQPHRAVSVFPLPQIQGGLGEVGGAAEVAPVLVGRESEIAPELALPDAVHDAVKESAKNDEVGDAFGGHVACESFTKPMEADVRAKEVVTFNFLPTNLCVR